MASLKKVERDLAQFANGTGGIAFPLNRIKVLPKTLAKRLARSPHLLSFLLSVMKLRQVIALDPLNMEDNLPSQVEEIVRPTTNIFSYEQSTQHVSEVMS